MTPPLTPALFPQHCDEREGSIALDPRLRGKP